MKKKYVVLFALCAALVAAMLTGCAEQNNEETLGTAASGGAVQADTTPGDVLEDPDTTETVGSGDATEATEDPGTVETEPEEQVIEIPDHIVVNTPYGYMQYRDQWAEFMRTEQQTEGDTVSVFFTAVINEVEYALFTVTVGGDNGEPICRMTDAAGVERNVYVYVEEIVSISALTEGEQDRLYAMQEEINYIIENIK